MTRKRYIVLQGIVGILAILSVLLGGCTGKDESFGAGLLPQGDFLYSSKYEETGTISAFTESEKKVLVSNPGSLVFGSFSDPLLGRTDAGFAAQFRLVADPGFDKVGDKIDSVVLIMTYKEIYGDTLTPQTINVFQLEKSLNPDANYFCPADTFFVINKETQDPIGSTTFVPKFKINYTVQDSVQYIRDTTKQIIRVRLNNDLGQRFIETDTMNYESNDAFLNFFKGLYIEPEPVAKKGTLMKLFPTESKVYVYYSNAESEPKVRYVAVTKNSAIVPRFNHVYPLDFWAHMNQEEIQDSLVFIKPNAGTRIKVNIPSLSDWAHPDSTGIIINKAMVTFHVDTLVSDLRRFTNPLSLYLKRIGNDDEEIFIDDAFLNALYYGGVYNAEKGTYTFNIAQHLQQLIRSAKEGELSEDEKITNNGFYLVHANRKNSFGRVLLKSSNSSKPIKLEISYSRYNNRNN